MTTPNPNKYAESSRRFMAQAYYELEIGDSVQASEKAWGAAACAIKAIAEQRQWNHRKHSLLYDASSQLADELSRPDLLDWFGLANALHQNYYEQWMPDEVVESYVASIELLVNELETIRQNPPPPFPPETRAQRRRLARLTAQSETATAETPE